MNIIPKAAFNQLKDDFKSIAKYNRPRKWETETLPLCEQQGFKFSAAQKRSMENLVY